MKRFFRNIHGSSFWRRVAAICLMLVMVATLLPADIKIARAETQPLSYGNEQAIYLSSLVYILQDEQDGQVIKQDLLLGEDTIAVSENARVTASVEIGINQPSSEDIQKEYVYHFPEGLQMEDSRKTTAYTNTGREIGTVRVTDNQLYLQMTDSAEDITGETVQVETEGRVVFDGALCQVAFPIETTGQTKNVTFTQIDTAVQTLGAGVPTVMSAGDTTDLFDNTTITMTKYVLKATYEDSTGSHVIEMNEDGEVSLPYNSKINMDLNFKIGDGNAITPGKTYIYKLPSSIRVDVENTHNLADAQGNSIGTVHISSDGTLTFEFNSGMLKDQTNVNFYVKFAGGLSDDLQEEGKTADITFPTESGGYNITIKTEDTTDKTPTVKPIGVQKSGAKQINLDGENYIEWTVSLAPNGRESIDGVIQDVLPAGLTYAKIAGYPELSGNKWGNTGTISCDTADGASTVTIRVDGCSPDYRTNVTFLTRYDETIFGGNKITADTVASVKNEAVFNPDDGTEGSSGDTTMNVKADMVSKSGELKDDGYIYWTVVLNQEKFDIKGTTYTDTLTGLGQELDVDSITVSPNKGTITERKTTGFTVGFTGTDPIKDVVTITYRTKVTDYAQPKYTNEAKLTGSNYDVTKTSSVNGIQLISKNCTNYNSVTQTFTWEIHVNKAGRDLTNVEVSDTFDAAKMTFVSASETLASGSDADQGQLKFHFDSLSEEKVITITTRVSDTLSYNENDYIEFKNEATMTSSLNSDSVNADASKWIQMKKPDLISKKGQMNGDGTITWTVTVAEPQLTVNEMKFQDELPEHMEYVEGSFCIQDLHQWDDSKRIYLTPTVSRNAVTQKSELTYVFDSSSASEAPFFKKTFQIVYKTRLNDYKLGNIEQDYTNHAKLTVKYDGDITVSDEAAATEHGKAGGTVDKTYAYKTGMDYVDWTVTINAAKNDMSGIASPTITDQLPDYFDYVSGSLTRVTADNKRETVSEAEYKVIVVNGLITVQLPRINSDTYIYTFRTKFNCLAEELSGKTISNTAKFNGTGESYEGKTGNVTNIAFNSSSAGAVIKNELRVKKIDTTSGQPLAGAEFELYLGDTCIATAVSGSDGYAVFHGIDPSKGYTFVLKEIVPPDGHTIKGNGETIITDYTEAKLQTDANGVKYYEIAIQNDSTVTVTSGKIQIQKQDMKGAVLENAKFGLYTAEACGEANLVTTRTTDADGNAAFTVDFGTYYLKEIESPEGYICADTVIKAEVTGQGTTYTVGGISSNVEPYVVKDEKAVGSLTLIKVKKGDTTNHLLGAEFGLYKDELCTDRVASGTTDADGKVTFGQLELGRIYYYRENKAPNGYILDNTVHAVTIGDGTEHVDVQREINVENQAAIGSIVIKKVDDAASANPLQGVEFVLLDESGSNRVSGTTTVITNEDGIARFDNIPFGTYTVRETNGKEGYEVTTSDTRITINKLGDTDVTVVNNAITFDIKITKQDSTNASILLPGAEFTLYTKNGIRVKTAVSDENGSVKFTDVAYGEYDIKETKAPDGYNINTTVYTIRKDNSGNYVTPKRNGETISVTVEDVKQNGSIEIKKEKANGDALQGAEFTLYDANGLNPIVKISDANGNVSFEGLAYGTYYLEETKAPSGYVRETKRYEIVVDSDARVTVDKDGTSLTVKNTPLVTTPPIVSFKIKKVDSETGEALAGAVFRLYKNGVASDITAVTGSNGYAYFRLISVETDPDDTVYMVKEETAPTGYRLSTASVTWLKTDMSTTGTTENTWVDDTATPKDEDKIKDISPAGNVKNEPIKGSLQITKTDILGGTYLAGAEYTLYQADGITPVSITGVTNPAKTNTSGIAVFTNLPYGTYYVKETKAPKGYTINSTVSKVTISSADTVQLTQKDTRIQLSISKQAIGGIQEISGAEFVLTQRGSTTPICTWTSSDVAYRIPADRLEVGTTYVLTEAKAPVGYGHIDPVEFTIQADGSISTTAELKGQTIVLRDRKIQISIEKVGSDTSGAGLPGTTFALYDMETGKVVEQWISGSSEHGIAAERLMAPTTGYKEYQLRELSAPDGYEVAEPITIAVKSDGSVYTVTGTGNAKSYMLLTDGKISVTDKKKPNDTIYVRKVAEGSREELSGAEFSILTEAEVEICSWVSDGRPHAISTRTSGLNVGVTYILRETKAPNGYLKAEDVRFRLTGAGKIELIQGIADNLNGDQDTLTVFDKPITLLIQKQNGFGTLLKGAKLRVSEYDAATDTIGTEIVTFQSDNLQPTRIDGLKLSCGTTYVLEELEAPAGYQLAENIVFTIDDQGEISRQDGVLVVNHKIIMEDKEAALGIGKVTLEGGAGLAGSTLMLTSEDDEFFVPETWESDGQVRTWDFLTFTPGCTYTLTEVKAPQGYAYADPIVFTIGIDDNQIYVKNQVMENRTVYIADGRLTMTVSKQDLYSQKELTGATLEILDEQGQIMDSWIADGQPHTVDTQKMVAGVGDAYAEYILREVAAPTGYQVAEDIRFAIDRNGIVYTVTQKADGTKIYTKAADNLLIMQDRPMLSVCKQDVDGSTIAGATFRITTAEDAAFQPMTFVSGEIPTYLSDTVFRTGITYTLTEEEAPQGYAYAEPITFQIRENGDVYVNGRKSENRQIAMVDTAITVKVAKQDAESKAGLAGAALVIKNEAGEILYSFSSETAAVQIPSVVFTAPKEAEYQYYTLTELAAPNGYEVADSIAFALDRDGQIYIRNAEGTYEKLTTEVIVMLDQPSADTSSSHIAKGPKTGDQAPIAWIGLTGTVSMLGAVLLLKKKTRK